MVRMLWIRFALDIGFVVMLLVLSIGRDAERVRCFATLKWFQVFFCCVVVFSEIQFTVDDGIAYSSEKK